MGWREHNCSQIRRKEQQTETKEAHGVPDGYSGPRGRGFKSRHSDHVNESRFSNNFIEKRGSFYLQTVAISGFLLFINLNQVTPFFQNSITIILPGAVI